MARKKRRYKKKKISTDSKIMTQHFQMQKMRKAWAAQTATIPNLLTNERNLTFENRMLTNTIPRSKKELPKTSHIINALAFSQEKINQFNRRLLIDEDEVLFRNNAPPSSLTSTFNLFQHIPALGVDSENPFDASVSSIH